MAWRRSVRSDAQPARPSALPAVALLGLAATTALVLSRIDPRQPGQPLPGCPFHFLTGLHCPGCGSTRCLHALLHGDVAAAWAMNPLLVLALPVVAFLAFSAAGWNPPRLQRLRGVLGAPKLWLVVLVGFGVLRNLPWLPFAWLAPG